MLIAASVHAVCSQRACCWQPACMLFAAGALQTPTRFEKAADDVAHVHEAKDALLALRRRRQHHGRRQHAPRGEQLRGGGCGAGFLSGRSGGCPSDGNNSCAMAPRSPRGTAAAVQAASGCTLATDARRKDSSARRQAIGRRNRGSGQCATTGTARRAAAAKHRATAPAPRLTRSASSTVAVSWITTMFCLSQMSFSVVSSSSRPSLPAAPFLPPPQAAADSELPIWWGRWERLLRRGAVAVICRTRRAAVCAGFEAL